MEKDKEHNDHPQTGPNVTITVNNKEVSIHRGHKTVAEIKSAGNVPLADDLNQLLDGKLTHLPNDGFVTIKGGEVFFSQPKTGGDS